MHVLLIRNILIIKPIDIHLLLSMPCPQQLNEIALELVRVLVDDFPRVFAYNGHVPDVRFGGNVAFEAVFIAALLCADLTVPAEAL